MFSNLSQKINYIFLIWALSFCIVTIFSFNYFFSENIDNVSLKNAKFKVNERGKFFNHFIEDTNKKVNFLRNIIVHNIENHGFDENSINKLVQKYTDFYNEITNVSLVDENGNDISNENNKLNINFLIDKLEKQKLSIVYSSFLLSKELKPFINILIPITVKNENAKYLLVSLSTQEFINSFTDTPLYDIKIFDNSGKILFVNNDQRINNSYYLRTSFSKDFDNIVYNELFQGENFVSKKLKTPFDNGFNLLLQIKKDYEYTVSSSNLSKIALFLFFTLVFFTILFMIISNIIKDYYQKINEYQKKLHQQSFETLSDYVLFSKTDLKGKITYASGGFSKLSGYSKKELLGKNHNIVRHEDVSAEIFKDMWLQIRNGKIWTGEIKNKKKNGEAYWVKTNIAPDYDENGKHIGYVSIREDITATKLIEKKNSLLNESFQYNKKLLELTEEAKIITDDAFHVINFNLNAKNLFDDLSYSKDFIEILDKLNYIDSRKIYNSIKAVDTQNQNQNFIFHAEHKFFKINVKRLKENQLLVIVSDITNLVKQKVYFENILNTSKSLIITISNNKLVNANKSFFEFFDCKDVEFFNYKHQQFTDIFLDKPGFIASFDRLKENSEIDDISNKNLKMNNVCVLDKNKKQKIFHIESSGKIFEDEDEELFILTDITEVETNRRLLDMQTKNAAMGEMIAMIAHQWRQPLTVLVSLLTRLNIMYRTNTLKENSFDEVFTKSSDIVHHLSQTIDDFKNYFKKENKVESITLSEIVQNSTKFFKESLSNNKIKLEVDYHGFENSKIELNSNILVQILINLIKNSIDAHKERVNDNKYIKVDIVLKEIDELLINVSDNAGGIENSIISKVFEPYFSTKSLNGTGLGLYMSKMIIENNFNGTIEVQNINDGASFKLKLQLNYKGE